MTPAGMAAAGPVQTFVVQCLGFVGVALVLVKWVFPQLGKILGGRTEGIEDTFRKLDQETREVAGGLDEIKAKLGRMQQESERRLQAALDDAAKTRNQLLSEAQVQVLGAAEKARREIQIERDKAVLELRQQATDLTLWAAGRLIESTMNDSIHDKLVERYLTQLDSVKKT